MMIQHSWHCYWNHHDLNCLFYGNPIVKGTMESSFYKVWTQGWFLPPNLVPHCDSLRRFLVPCKNRLSESRWIHDLLGGGSTNPFDKIWPILPIPSMVYLPTFTIKNKPNVGTYANSMDSSWVCPIGFVFSRGVNQRIQILSVQPQFHHRVLGRPRKTS